MVQSWHHMVQSWQRCGLTDLRSDLSLPPQSCLNSFPGLRLSSVNLQLVTVRRAVVGVKTTEGENLAQVSCQ